MRVHATKGYLEANLVTDIIRYEIYGQEHKELHVTVEETFGGHGGGDTKMVDDVVNDLLGIKGSQGLTSIEKSVMSHRIGFAAERSRLAGGAVEEIK